MSNVYPVVHHANKDLTLVQASLINDSGAAGLFLISHDGRDVELIALAKQIKNMYPRLKVGLNYLRLGVIKALEDVLNNDLDMVWGDDCGVSSEGGNYTAVQLQELPKRKIDVFASVAFKYQPIELYPVQAAIEAYNWGFIPTTSGEATGLPPTVEKIKSMSEAVNGNLAVASGMNCENIYLYKEYLSDILISTGISVGFHTLDENLLNRFVNEAR